MRGSIALEFLLVVLAIAVYIGFTVKAVEVVGLQSAEDISKMTRTKAAMTKIFNAVQFLSAGSDGSETTVYPYIPTDVNIILDGSQIKAVIPTEANLSNIAYCTATECTFVMQSPLPFDSTTTITGGTVHAVTLSRSAGKVKVSVS